MFKKLDLSSHDFNLKDEMKKKKKKKPEWIERSFKAENVEKEHPSACLVSMLPFQYHVGLCATLNHNIDDQKLICLTENWLQHL